MEVVAHPYLEGVLCREDGAVYVPASGTCPGHWTFGYVKSSGYRQVGIARKPLLAHRVICEAFHGVCPPDKQEVDHIDRNPANNKPENLRWCSRSENCHNKKVCDESLAKYGVGSTGDRVAYNRALYANNPEFRERLKARRRALYANDPEFREKQKARNRVGYTKRKEKKNGLSKGNGDCCNKG